MKIASVADVKAHFSAYLKESEAGPVVITCNGRPAAILLNVIEEDEIEGCYSPTHPSFVRFYKQLAAKSNKRAGFRMMNFGNKWMRNIRISRISNQ